VEAWKDEGNFVLSQVEWLQGEGEGEAGGRCDN